MPQIVSIPDPPELVNIRKMIGMALVQQVIVQAHADRLNESLDNITSPVTKWKRRKNPQTIANDIQKLKDMYAKIVDLIRTRKHDVALVMEIVEMILDATGSKGLGKGFALGFIEPHVKAAEQKIPLLIHNILVDIVNKNQ